MAGMIHVFINAPAPNTRLAICDANCGCQKRRINVLNNVIPGYNYIKYLGSGAFGSVHLYQDRKTSKTVAIKMISFNNQHQNFHMVISEYKIVIRIPHKNILKYYNCFYDASKCYIVMEYASHGSLRNTITNQAIKKVLFYSSFVLQAIRGIIEGVQHLNNHRVVHCDLKPENIVIGDDGRMKICDFGTARYDYDFNSPVCGTTMYMAPERFQPNMRPNEKTEVWSIGIILYELCNLRHPFGQAGKTGQMLNMAKLKQYPPLNSYYGSDMNTLLVMMLRFHPNNRYTLSNLLKFPLLRR